MANPHGKIRTVVFENDANLVACTTVDGFSIFSGNSEMRNLQPVCAWELTKHPAFKTGCRLISLIGNSNVVALTPNSETSQNVYLWDRTANQELASVGFGDTVWGIRLRPDILVAATAKKISVRSLSDFSEIAVFDTAFNKEGTFDIPATLSSSLIAFPAPDIGVVSICDYLEPSVRPLNVHAFKSPVGFIKFSDNGRLLAVAGDDGKNISVFSVPSMKPVAFLRRGLTGSRLLSMSFEPHGTQLAVASTGGTLHVFFIAWEDPAIEKDTKSPTRAMIKLKDPDSHPAWVFFSAKTLKLGGVTINGHPFKVKFDDDEKGKADIERDPKPLYTKGK